MLRSLCKTSGSQLNCISSLVHFGYSHRKSQNKDLERSRAENHAYKDNHRRRDADDGDSIALAKAPRK